MKKNWVLSSAQVASPTGRAELDSFIEQRIFVQIASQVELVVRGAEIFRVLQKRVLKWGCDSKRNLRNIPAEAWEGNSFEIDQDNSEQAEAIRLDEPRYWAFRLRERLKDTSRVWTTEVAIAERSAQEVVFGVRLICAQRGNAEPIPRSIPNFVRAIAFTQDSYLDDRKISANPWLVQSEQDVDDLVVFLKATHRHHPVVVFATSEGSENIGETAMPIKQFIRRTVGVAHAVVITSSASFFLTNRIGKEFSVYRRAVRTYNPGFSLENDLPTDHPVATFARIAGWGDDVGSTFEDFLTDQSIRITRTRDVLERVQPSFQQVKLIAAQRARESASAEGQGDAELLRLADDELRVLKQETEVSLQLALNADNEREQALSELRQIKASYIALQGRLEKLFSDDRQDVKQYIPSGLDEIEEWADNYLSGQVELHVRAIKSARNSDFKDVELVYNALLMMRDLYVPMRLKGGIKHQNAFQHRLRELGLENSRCFKQKNKAQKFDGEYFVKYQESKRELDWHLQGNSSRDGRLGFRMYYFWDSETSRVVVGHLPGHLRNDAS